MSDESPRRCYRAESGIYFERDTHRRDCDEHDCRGCTRCEGHHCTARHNCTWHLDGAELTCGRCLASVRTDLRWIAALTSLMLPAAVEDGLDSDAANLAGPSADPEAWSWRKVAAKQGRAWHVSLEEDDDEEHPVRVLGTWERMIREDYGHDTDAPLTVLGAAGYLDRQLHRIAHDDEQDFPLLARELRKCRQHVEAALHNVERAVRGAPCPECTGEESGVGPRLTLKPGHWCTDPTCRRLHYSTTFDADTGETVPDTSGDVWVCSRDRRHRWTHRQYEAYVQERRARSA